MAIVNKKALVVNMYESINRVCIETHGLVTMSTEEECKDLFKEVIENHKTYHVTEAEKESYLQAETELLAEQNEDKPYSLLVRVIFTALERKAHELREKLLGQLSQKDIKELPLVCNSCQESVWTHGEYCRREKAALCESEASARDEQPLSTET